MQATVPYTAVRVPAADQLQQHIGYIHTKQKKMAACDPGQGAYSTRIAGVTIANTKQGRQFSGSMSNWLVVLVVYLV